MAEKKYAKYIVSKPKFVELPHHAKGQARGFTYPYPVYMDDDLLKGSPVFLSIGWRTEIPYPQSVSGGIHSHAADELLLYMGSDPDNLQDLGGEIEIQLEDEKYVINTTSSIFIPKGIKHSTKVLKVDRPILSVAMVFKGKYD